MRIEFFALGLLLGVSIVATLEALNLRALAFPLGVVVFILGIVWEIISFRIQIRKMGGWQRYLELRKKEREEKEKGILV